MRGTRFRLSACLLGLALAGAAFAETGVDLSLSSDLAGGQGGLSAVMGIDTALRRRLGKDMALALDFSAEGAWGFLDSSFSGSGKLDISAYRMRGSTNLGLRLVTAGVLPSALEAGSLEAALSLPMTFNGSSLSLSLAPVVSVDPMESGYGSLGLEAGLSWMVGTFVLKPGLGLALVYPWSGGLALSLKPGLKAAWYPGIPLSLEISGEYLMSGGGVAYLPENTLRLDCVGTAAPTAWLLLTCLGSASLGPTATAAKLSLEGSFTLARDDRGREWAIPLMLGYESSQDAYILNLSLGLRCTF